MSLSEFEIIHQYFSRIGLGAAHKNIVLGIGDDSAIVEIPPTHEQCISTDMLIESVHFPAEADPFLLGQRALAVNLSDLAAMGAMPLCFTLGLALPRNDEQWLAGFSAGLLEMAQQHQCPLVGGDTTRGPLTISIQVHGLVETGRALRRDGAKKGDSILVTGYLGKGAIALAAMGHTVHFDSTLHRQLETISAANYERLQEYFYCPKPRLSFSQQAASLISSAIDISDGLLGDLGHILQRSEVGARIKLQNIPFDPLMVECTDLTQRQSAALYGGDDYELCLTAATENVPALMKLAEEAMLPLTVVGEITAETGLKLIDSSGQEQDADALSYDHFNRGDSL